MWGRVSGRRRRRCCGWSVPPTSPADCTPATRTRCERPSASPCLTAALSALNPRAETEGPRGRALLGAGRFSDPTLRVAGRAGRGGARAGGGVGLPFPPEAFAARRYRPDGSLLPRSEPGAVLTDAEEVARQ